MAACQVGNVLFDTPVGASNGAAGNNGKTRIIPFHCAMFSTNGPPLPATAHPYFAVIDSNEAHHLSTFLVERAFATVAPGWAKVIVNFDYHDDYTLIANVDSFRCDNWGGFAIRPIGGLYAAPIADFYVGLGGRPNPWQTSFYCMRRPETDGRKQQLAGPTVQAQANALLWPR